jgi:hypothetical protein
MSIRNRQYQKKDSLKIENMSVKMQRIIKWFWQYVQRGYLNNIECAYDLFSNRSSVATT